VHATDEGFTDVPLVESVIRNDTVSGCPATGRVGLMERREAARAGGVGGVGVAATTFKVIDAWLFAGFGSVAVSSVSCAVSV